ncbi:MAG: helix-turn-helix domain-containing protein [Pseudomonadota bacterium]
MHLRLSSQTMELKYYLPRPDLQDYVRAYYYFSTDIPAEQPLCAELGNIRILLNGAGRMHLPGGRVEAISSAFLLGPTMGAYKIEMQAKTRVFGVGIRPRGWGALLGINASEVTDDVFDFSDFAGRIAGQAIEQVGNATDISAMAAVADQYFADVLERRRHRTCRYPEALEHWLLNPNELDLDRLVEMMDVSRRQTDRIAKQVYGASPKLLQRKYRALRAADRIRAGQTHWTAAAGPSFYDQSHFIKEFRTFIGVTPHQFASKEAKLISTVQSVRRSRAGLISLASV